MQKNFDEWNKVNTAYIDAANLDKGLEVYCDWKLDYKKFRVWLKDKYKIEKAYIFIGFIPKYKTLYKYLLKSGFILIFKKVIYQKGNHRPKGNCDSDLIMKAVEDYYEGKLNKAVLISSDGDYYPLIKKLMDNNSFYAILSPAPPNKFSILLKRTNAKIIYIKDQKKILKRN